eukprot:TRINITY_DN5725_c0_g1_i1.p1 TRINITY_DN5725_c0_g1~~TRINITY_DN5725_c0_g1_i1.p1  ORF type:complete len:304 (+),score=18.78 TRINITY_DN5725_c0_g1_i1:150-1061(+)
MCIRDRSTWVISNSMEQLSIEIKIVRLIHAQIVQIIMIKQAKQILRFSIVNVILYDANFLGIQAQSALTQQNNFQLVIILVILVFAMITLVAQPVQLQEQKLEVLVDVMKVHLVKSMTLNVRIAIDLVPIKLAIMIVVIRQMIKIAAQYAIKISKEYQMVLGQHNVFVILVIMMIILMKIANLVIQNVLLVLGLGRIYAQLAMKMLKEYQIQQLAQLNVFAILDIMIIILMKIANHATLNVLLVMLLDNIHVKAVILLYIEFWQQIINASVKINILNTMMSACLLYTSPSPRDRQKSRMPSSA